MSAPRIARLATTVLVFCAALLLSALPATAYDEPSGAPEHHAGNPALVCTPCHRPGDGSQSNGCLLCHPIHGSITDPVSGKGPHGLYAKTTDRCSACHTLHEAGGAKLLSRATIGASCLVCHDGTGGRGVYGAVLARTGIEPSAAHRIETATIVPGGSASTGDSSTMPFKGPGATLTCSDCHSPHDANTVGAYGIERWRSSYSNMGGGTPGLTYRQYQTTHLLRRSPAGSSIVATDYGSDWCLACHAGRVSGMGAVHNHPVDSASTVTTPYTYENVPILASIYETGLTMMGGLAGTNRGYLMPYPRTDEQSGHGPICQQCHEDSRYVGLLLGDGSTALAEPSTITTPDGWEPNDNPRFQNFPHETVNRRMAVETGDGLCKNCHPPGQLR
jgi:predicted CXXCH cytochrome family protein